MAIGCARLFGIKLPVNFFSPYKARSIVEFWRRWHITLSRFLRDYLYISLGGNRLGKLRRYFNLFLTMLLGGLWHGAGWPFVVWGALHGCYLILNHAWRRTLGAAGMDFDSNPAYQCLSWLITFTAVVVGWVYFRAPTLEHGNAILMAMAGRNGAELPNGIFARLGAGSEFLEMFGIQAGQGSGSAFVGNFAWVMVSGIAVLTLPNVAQLFHRHNAVLYEHAKSFREHLDQSGGWNTSVKWAVATALLLLLGVLTLSQISEFLYLQF